MRHFDRAMHRGGYENLSSEDIEREVRALDNPGQLAAHHDPIFTPIFVAMGLGNITIAGISAATIASAIATTALSLGVQHR